MVDTFMAYEQVKSLLYRAVCGLAEDSDDIECIVHALKALVGKTGKQIFGEAIQIHGGMGITDELDIGHYAKRLMMINTKHLVERIIIKGNLIICAMAVIP